MSNCEIRLRHSLVSRPPMGPARTRACFQASHGPESDTVLFPGQPLVRLGHDLVYHGSHGPGSDTVLFPGQL